MILFETKGFPPNHPFSQSRRDADRRGAAADLAARLQRLFGRARGACRRGFLVRASFLGFSAGGADAELPRQFKPSAWRQTPYAILGVAAIFAETEAEAIIWRRAPTCISHAAPIGEYGPLASPDEARRLSYTPVDRQRIEHNRTAADRRLARAGTRAHHGAGAGDAGGRGDDHHDGVRSHGAKALVRAAGEGVWAQGLAAGLCQNRPSPTPELPPQRSIPLQNCHAGLVECAARTDCRLY